MAVTAAQVKELRERTGLGMMDCKKALTEAGGDIDLAIETLRKSSGMKAAKKAGRTASDGLVRLRRGESGDAAILVEVNCETDFAARDDNFRSFVDEVADAVFETKETDVAKLLESGFEAKREALVQKIGENVSIRRAALIDNPCADYVHTNGKIGVLVALDGGDDDLAKDVAMHIAASNPMVVSPDDVPSDVVEKEREIYAAQAADSGKPENIVDKMVEGRVRKYLAEISLTEQPFVKDTGVTVGKLLKGAGASVASFVRYEVGEGIEKEEEDFAAEVAAQMNQD